MSAARQRMESAIRRIALTPEERRQLLGESQNKGGKPGSAGVGASEVEESRLCCDGSTSGNANPGTDERDPDSSSQDGLDSDDPAKLGNEEGTLSGVTDCATGEPICFDGSGFIPPDGWDEPNDPPIDPTYVENDYWETEFGEGCLNGSRSATRDGAIEAYIACQTTLKDVTYELEFQGTSGNSLERWYYQVHGTRISNGESLSYQKSSSRYNCSVQQEGASYCDPDPEDIVANSWPSDGCTNLAIVGGKIVGSKFDPDQDGSYSAPRDSIDLCDSENGARITLRPSGQSDWKTIDAINGGDGYLYSGGKQIARVSGDEFTDPTV